MTNNYGPIRGCQNQYSTNISLLCLERSKVRKAFPRRVSILFYLSEPIGKKLRTLCHTGPFHVTMLNLWFCSGSLLCLPVPVWEPYVIYGSLTCYHAELVVLQWFPTQSTGTSMRTLTAGWKWTGRIKCIPTLKKTNVTIIFRWLFIQ